MVSPATGTRSNVASVVSPSRSTYFTVPRPPARPRASVGEVSDSGAPSGAYGFDHSTHLRSTPERICSDHLVVARSLPAASRIVALPRPFLGLSRFSVQMECPLSWTHSVTLSVLLPDTRTETQCRLTDCAARKQTLRPLKDGLIVHKHSVISQKDVRFLLPDYACRR